ncbi:UDP-N-acetylglucosamine 2-epimerase (non-hydrolyzing) [bacterium]|nr:UDP-N-acetylglucosamine 2-epimerase (non-hydrolyzing) [bacterium]
MKKKKILFVFGTRPEAIKVCPLIKLFEEKRDFFETRVCVTAQHREMLDQVLSLFEVKPHFDLNLMKPGQDLGEITGKILCRVQTVIREIRPDIVFVQGDTTTAFASSLASYYEKVSVGHIEAGLRTGNPYSPWPEEVNRCLIGQIARIHYAPTKKSQLNLLREGRDENTVIITGNTVIDALFWVLERIKTNRSLRSSVEARLTDSFSSSSITLDSIITKKRNIILITGHRRENFGEGFMNICEALKRIALENEEVDLVYPVHLNPNVQKPVFELLGKIKNIHLIDPLEYESFIYLMSLSTLILTDSGGVQEEAPSLGKPVLVMRDTTERPEAVEAGTVKLVGTDPDTIYSEATILLRDPDAYKTMAQAHNPYGDGTACRQIADHIYGEYFGSI